MKNGLISKCIKIAENVLLINQWSTNIAINEIETELFKAKYGYYPEIADIWSLNDDSLIRNTANFVVNLMWKEHC